MGYNYFGNKHRVTKSRQKPQRKDLDGMSRVSSKRSLRRTVFVYVGIFSRWVLSPLKDRGFTACAGGMTGTMILQGSSSTCQPQNCTLIAGLTLCTAFCPSTSSRLKKLSARRRSSCVKLVLRRRNNVHSECVIPRGAARYPSPR